MPSKKPYVPLFQESLKRRPFWMLVGCVMVNRTRWKQARPVHAAIMARWGSALGLSRARAEEVKSFLRPLGLSHARAINLVKLAEVWARHGGGWHRRNYGRSDVKGLPGCGDYAADSWVIFVLDRWNQPGVTDKRLLEYQERRAAFEDYCVEKNLAEIGSWA